MRVTQPMVAAVLVLSSGCTFFKEKKAEVSKPLIEAKEEKIEPVRVDDLVAGYALLGQLMGDEKDLSKLLIIKKERPELNAVVKRISETAKLSHDHLVALQGKHGFDRDNLPPTESAARKLISNHRAKELILEGGKNFELKLLLAQNEALTYGAALAEALAKREPDSKQQQWLLNLSNSLSGLQKQVYDLFFQHYSWQKPS
jgi:hypothetical protein